VRRAIAGAIVLVAVAGAIAVGLSRRGQDEGARCGPGFTATGARCLPAADACPAPLASTARGCDAPEAKVLVPAGAIAVGPSDWEAEGRVAARSIRVQAFRMDAFEVTRGQLAAATGGLGVSGDFARAASGVTMADAMAYCRSKGGRLPTEDEWIVAAVSASNPPRRYPWGDTGAVCRRAAWGLDTGPCAHGADGPDTVGAHPDGDTAMGIHDMAGNVAEWVTAPAGETSPDASVAKGGSWATALAADLRIWARLELPAGSRDPRVGFRCVYAP
jgi:formylglycine-generating enzyme required for sulfatase activity